MTIAELMRYLPYAPNQDEDVILLDQKTYDKMIRELKAFENVKNYLREVEKQIKIISN